MKRAHRLVFLAVTTLLGAAPTPDFRIATAPYRFSFPHDHGAHNEYQTEWWYFTGHLHAPDGGSFGYELTFFRFGLRAGDPSPSVRQSQWRGNQTYAAHLAITDEQRGRFVYDARFAREALGMGGAATGRLAVHVGDWTLSGASRPERSKEQMWLHAPDGGRGLSLVLEPEKPPAIHGRLGTSRKAPCRSCASHYYSYTRIATRGTLTNGGKRLPVTGISWMDHEYGSTELATDESGWDWFSLQLDDGREVMIYLVRRRDGSVTTESSGSLIARDGHVVHLTGHDFSVTVRGNTHWRSPHTGADYPSLWEIAVPRARLYASLAPSVADQELVLEDAGLTYWEGAVKVQETATGGRRLGVGYVELTGYAAPVLR